MYYYFEDYPEFQPNITPRDIIGQGAFGGTYFRPIYSSINKKYYADQHKEFEFFNNIPDNLLTRPYSLYDSSINKYGVRVGTTLEFWEKKGWIHPQDPYGWFQWYCRFWNGRRTPDDLRQIKRWLAFKKRFKSNKTDNIKQTLLHWAIVF